MSRNSNDSAYGGSSSGGSWGRRKSGLFTLSSFSASNGQDGSSKSGKMLKKHHKRPSMLAGFEHQDLPETDGRRSKETLAQQSPGSPNLSRPSLTAKSGMKRPPSVFGSFKSSMRSNNDTASDPTFEPLSATSTVSAASIGDATIDAHMSNKTVLLHGEVQTSAGMFRKKKEYLVLAEHSITRYKSQAKASEVFSAIPHPVARTPTMRHGQMPSLGSASDLQTLQTLSDSSGDKSGRVLLRHVVAVSRLDDGKPYFAIEVCYLDEESTQSAALTLQFGNPEERDVWLKSIRRAVTEERLKDQQYISPFNLETAARTVERDNDYDPANCAVYKVVQRQSAGKSAGRSSSEDLAKMASTVCFLAIGVHKVHLIPLVKAVTRSSSPSLAPNLSQWSHGILNLTSVKVSHTDDTFELAFRQPLQGTRHVYLASSASHEIAARLHYAENFLRPEYTLRLFRFNVPEEVDFLVMPSVFSDVDEHSCFQRTLTGYCVAYGVNPANVRYTINYHCEDAPRFELLPPADGRRPEYGPLDLLAIMRALRYNESFGSLSFANIPLDGLNGLHDNYGKEYVCSTTKHGTPIRLTREELDRSCLLVQEVRALAATSKKLRRLDFTGCIAAKPVPTKAILDDEVPKIKDIGCGIVEALFPLCRHQTTNVDWIALNGIQLSDTDLDYLVGAAVEKACHFRAIELNRCGLNDRSTGLILDALRAQDNTLEAIEIAGNTARINPVAFDAQLGIFGFIRKLNLSYVSRTSGPEPLLTAETLLIWRLSELRLSGTTLNSATINAVSTYLAHPNSNSLHELFVDHAYLSGSDVATLLHSMSRESSHREMHLDISQNHITKDLDQVTQAISSDMAPSHVTMRAIEYRDEASFRKMLGALTINKTIKYLDMSHAALPCDASTETCRALERLLAENDTLLDLNMSGEDSRLATSKIGPGINSALAGLKRNKTLQTFHIERQKLGIQGASTLAEVIRENNTLRELHCDNNDIPLQGLTDLVNSLVENTTIIHLPSMDDGRAAALLSAEMTMKSMSENDSPTSARPSQSSKNSPLASSSLGMKRGLASVRRTAQRTATAYTPSFPALQSYGRTSNSPTSPLSQGQTMPPPRSRQASGTGPTAAPLAFTVQDVQTTHRLLTEQWDRQCFRLAQYLDRNWCILHDMPVDTQLPDEKFERPESVGSLAKVLEQVKYDTTPRVEKGAYFEAPEPGTIDAQSAPPPKKDDAGAFSFKQFILDSSPDDDEVAGSLKQLRIDTDVGSEPRTPTQGEFR